MHKYNKRCRHNYKVINKQMHYINTSVFVRLSMSESSLLSRVIQKTSGYLTTVDGKRIKAIKNNNDNTLSRHQSMQGG